MDSPVVLQNYTVLVEGDVIVAMGPAGSVDVPDDAVRVEGNGGYLMPGLADLHVHLQYEEDLPLYIANGVTTVLDMGGGPGLLAWRDRVAARNLYGPHMLLSYFIDGVGGRANVVDSAESARESVAAAGRSRYDYIKVYNSLTTAQFDAIIEEAGNQGIRVIGHGVREPGLGYILESGQVLVAHAEEYLYSFFDFQDDRSRIQEAVDLTRETGAYLIPNLSAYEIMAILMGKAGGGGQLPSDSGCTFAVTGSKAGVGSCELCNPTGLDFSAPPVLTRTHTRVRGCRPAVAARHRLTRDPGDVCWRLDPQRPVQSRPGRAHALPGPRGRDGDRGPVRPRDESGKPAVRRDP